MEFGRVGKHLNISCVVLGFSISSKLDKMQPPSYRMWHKGWLSFLCRSPLQSRFHRCVRLFDELEMVVVFGQQWKWVYIRSHPYILVGPDSMPPATLMPCSTLVPRGPVLVFEF